ncbi:MAG: DUF5107 domain-containing protein [Clostridiaceae bacterium]|nr:DUF5107 domain-containing protein [Clostridiaceae bacterium]
MSSLVFCDYEMPSASLGKPNPLPDIRNSGDQHASIVIDEKTVTADEARYMGWGHVNGILPYLIQDGYNRIKKPRIWKAAVLENRYIRAVFLPELGGRLWSLIDKTTSHELLHCNPVFQPCNLALRNAWISGGVEWNIGIIGHSPFTVDKMFVETLSLADGTPVLRMYQYERIRRLVYRVEAILPDDAHHLYVRVRIDNTADTDTAVYWWSNMAVDEREDVRVVVPADKAFRYGYGGKLAKVGVPYMIVEAEKLKNSKGLSGTLLWDISRTTGLPQAMDFFFDLPRGQRRWISAVGGDGYGFVQSSTDVLQGRKLFVWGMGTGGRNWQAFLSKPGSAYLEIQAGLAHTQLEHLPMKSGQVISWMETYGPITADAALVQGTDWRAAAESLGNALEKTCPRADVDKMLAAAEQGLGGHSGQIIFAGAGWAHVQQALLQEKFHDGGLRFPRRHLGIQERIWLQLARERSLPCPDPLKEPGSYQIGPEWETLLGDTIREGGSRHWFGYYQYAVTRVYAGKLREADEAFSQSLDCSANPWALRCKAVIRQMAGNEQEAAELLKQAVRMLPERNIAKEALISLSKAGRPQEVIQVYRTLPAAVRKLGRLKVVLIEALLDTGAIAEAERMLNDKIELSDVREGEVKLTDLWFRLYAMKQGGTGRPGDPLLEQAKRERTPPVHLDFRMQ